MTPSTEAQSGTQATAPPASMGQPGGQLDGPACPRRHWFSRHHDHNHDHHRDHRQEHGQGFNMHVWHHHVWHRRQSCDSKGSSGTNELTLVAGPSPHEWQHWHEHRRHRHCPSRSQRAQTSPRPLLDDSRWLEDYFAWY